MSTIRAKELQDLAGNIIEVSKVVNTIFSKHSVSAGFTVASAGLITYAHGLGEKPKFYRVMLRCLNDRDGFTAGDETDALHNMYSANNNGYAVVADETDIRIRFGSHSEPLVLTNFTSGVADFLEEPDWELFIEAWA